jgi:hypothetical protein
MKLGSPRRVRVSPQENTDEYLARVQAEVGEERWQDFVAINLTTGEYVLGKRPHQAFSAFRSSWPGNAMLLCRVDGGPAYRFHGPRL